MIKKLDSESAEREEKEIFHGTINEYLKILQTIASFANCRGGKIFINQIENLLDFKKFFDAANLENGINRLVEPVTSGIISVGYFNRQKGVKIGISSSPRAPHFYKRDEFMENDKGEKFNLFRKGTIPVRRSGKNEIFNSIDFNQFLQQKFVEFLGNAQISLKNLPTKSFGQRIAGNFVFPSPIIRERKVAVSNYGKFKPSVIAEKVRSKIRKPFSPSTHHPVCWKYWKVRPSPGSSNPEKTKKKYCVYDKPHNDYLYTKQWLNFLVKQLSKDEMYNKLFRK